MTTRPADPVTAARCRLLSWSIATFIAGDPGLNARHDRALADLEDADPAIGRAALGEVAAVFDEARAAVGWMQP